MATGETTVALTGNTYIAQPVRRLRNPRFLDAVGLLRSFDVTLTNLECALPVGGAFQIVAAAWAMRSRSAPAYDVPAMASAFLRASLFTWDSSTRAAPHSAAVLVSVLAQLSRISKRDSRPVLLPHVSSCT